MNTSDVLTIAKAHPDTVSTILGTVATAAQADPTLIPDVIAAVETKNFGGLLKHIGLLLQLAGIIGGNPAIVSAVGSLAKKG